MATTKKNEVKPPTKKAETKDPATKITLKQKLDAIKYKKAETKTPATKMTLKEKLDAIKYKAPEPKVADKPEKRKSLRRPSGLQTLQTLQPLK
jgi:hypothetical protein